MRSEENPLDLNNLPEDYTKDGKQVLEDTSSYSGSAVVGGGGGYRKLQQKSGGGREDKEEEEEEESRKVYECRFCSLKFCKSQALGGHMNRHRQERETETLNRARQLVFSNDSILGQAPSQHLGQQFPYGGGYHQTSNLNEELTPPFQSIYTPRMYSGCSAASLLQPPPPPPPSQPPYIYSSPPRLIPYTSQYPVNDYVIGHVLPLGNTTTLMAPAANNYTCIGTPIGKPFGSDMASELVGSGGGGCSGGNFKEMPLYNNDRELGLDWHKF